MSPSEQLAREFADRFGLAVVSALVAHEKRPGALNGSGSAGASLRAGGCERGSGERSFHAAQIIHTGE